MKTTIMTNLNNLLVVIILLTTMSCGTKTKPVQQQSIKVNAPFEMPEIIYPDFSECAKFPITDFGAVQGDQQLISAAITAAIDAANQAGGGSVIIPEGEWLTGKVHLKSNVNLHLEKGAVLLFNDNPDDYLPAVHTTWEGMECYNYSPLVYAYECKNVAITGEGELKAKMDLWRTWFSRPRPHMNSLKRLYEMASAGVPVEERIMVNDTANLRPHFIQLNRCENVLLDGIKVTNSPFWTIHPYLCKNVVLRNLKVFAHGHNNDGVDPEMTQNMLVEDCEFDQGDDAIAVKSGRNQDAWRLNTPTRNLVIRNCTVKNGHQLLAVGSEMSGGVENVFMDSCTVADGANMFHLVFLKTNERRGGFINNIHVSNIKADKMSEGILGIETDVLYQWRNLVPTYERRLTTISNIYLENFEANDVKFISRILGNEELPVKNVNLKNISVKSVEGEEFIHENVLNFNFEK
ncbi:glycoside hydrolase family 28 protein [Draconibacterium sp. IB214405]|uniref:glycoside hydrolase family 28 protein n=1 Tax=Draconibacterium sp. IB214405 TaxID=3097352 RepID=UPI002A0D2E61|nr:glycoside hydrolase family 28 protein [Draconibacterium sp. IB214405]MDX8339381.1 glycoside hydrolase family 28 protein [Draconibacterium sp. IB214405]